MACDLLNPSAECLDPANGTVGGLVSGAATSAWEAVCKSFADATVSMLSGFADAFVRFPNVDLSADGLRNVYGISLGVASLIAAILLLIQIGRTAFMHDGAPFAHAIIGLGKALLTFLATLSVTGAALVAADEASMFIVNRTFGSATGLRDKLTSLFKWSPNMAPSLVLLLAIVGLVLITVLWTELLFRNAAIAVLIGTSPIAAAGQVSEAAKAWWTKLATAVVQLIVLKPVIALVFSIGFTMLNGTQQDLNSLITGMLILLLAALAWPAIARFFTFTTVHVGGGAGLAGVLGFAAGRASAGGGGPAGVDPAQFGQAAEGRTMSAVAARSGTSTAGGGTGAAAGSGAGAAAAAGGAAGGVTVALSKGLEMAQRAVNSITSRMEHMAGHGGMSDANPHAHPAGHPRYSPAPSWPAATGGETSAPEPASPAVAGEPTAPVTTVSAPSTGQPPEPRTQVRLEANGGEPTDATYEPSPPAPRMAAPPPARTAEPPPPPPEDKVEAAPPPPIPPQRSAPVEKPVESHEQEGEPS